MLPFRTTILKFQKKGEKTGWSYIAFTPAQAKKLKDSRVSFRVKGKLDALAIRQTALIPMGDGGFILALNATLRKKLGKQAGDSITVALEADEKPFEFFPEFVACLKDEPAAWKYFQTLPPGHQRYFSKWITTAKTSPTRAKRIMQAVVALAQGQGYSEMMRAAKNEHL
jgi:hypothetical protein